MIGKTRRTKFKRESGGDNGIIRILFSAFILLDRAKAKWLSYSTILFAIFSQLVQNICMNLPIAGARRCPASMKAVAAVCRSSHR